MCNPKDISSVINLALYVYGYDYDVFSLISAGFPATNIFKEITGAIAKAEDVCA